MASIWTLASDGKDPTAMDDEEVPRPWKGLDLMSDSFRLGPSLSRSNSPYD